MTPPKGFDPEQPTCPQCGGDMWDNRNDKASERSPDFKCKREGDASDCEGKVWMEPPPRRNGNGRGGRGASSNGGSRNNGSSSAQPAREPAPAPAAAPTAKLTRQERALGRGTLRAAYVKNMDWLAEQMKGVAAKHGLALTMAEVQAATFSLVKLMDGKRYLDPPADITVGGRPTPLPARTPAAAPAPRPAPQRELAAVGAGDGFGPDGQALDDDDDLPF